MKRLSQAVVVAILRTETIKQKVYLVSLSAISALAIAIVLWEESPISGISVGFATIGIGLYMSGYLPERVEEIRQQYRKRYGLEVLPRSIHLDPQAIAARAARQRQNR